MSIHVCECVHNGRDEYHLRYPGMSKAAAQEIADKINGGALSRKQAQPEPHPDDKAVDAMAAAMKEKLAQAREKGRGGWETCSQQDLSRLLREHVDKGDPRDVANFCAFLYALGFGIAQPEPVEPNNDEVICPNCVHQFRAIPQNVQRLMLDAGFEPPFKAQPEPVELTEDQVMAAIRKSGCYDTVKMSRECGPYDITEPTTDAMNFAKAVLEAAKGGHKC